MSSQQKQKNNISFWEQRRGILHTSKGGWVIGEAVYNQGYSMLDDFVGSTSFFQVLVLNATGRFPERILADWLEALFICLSWPDARIWCNQVGSLAGTLQASPVAAVSSGILASDSRMYGPGCMEAACNFITEAYRQNQQLISPEEIVALYPKRRQDGTPVIAGYARPIATGDERIAAMERTARKLGLKDGAHVSLAYKVERLMQDRHGESMNLAGYGAAFLVDLGFSAHDTYRVLSCWVNSGAHACYAEAADQPPESFFPLHCEDIDYQGKPSRSVPKRG